MHSFTQSFHTSVWSTTMVFPPWTSLENDAELNPLTSTQEIKEHFQLFVTAMWLYTQCHECILTAPIHEPLYAVVNVCFCTHLTLFHCCNWCGAVQTVIHTHLNLLLHNQGQKHIPRMHRSLKAYCETLLTPLMFLDVPTFTTRCLHVHTTQEIQAAKGGTCGREH